MKKRMRKSMAALLLCATMVFPLAGCVAEDDTVEEQLPVESETVDHDVIYEEVISAVDAVATDVEFERQIEEGMERAILRGYAEDGNVVWTYETGEYEAAQLYRTDEIGRNGDRFYFVEDGAVVALNVSDGSVLWKNDEFGGSGSYTFGDDGTVYVSGYFGPDFMAIDLDGTTLCYIDAFDPEYYWAYEITYLGDQVAVTMSGTPSGEEETIYVNLTDYTYSLPSDDAAPEEEPDTDENVISEDDILETLFAKTGMEPYTYYYDAFAKDGTYGIIAIYQYSSAYMENDNCQVWYCDGVSAELLFDWENNNGNVFCNVLNVMLYQNAEGMPYVVLNTWQRIALSYEYCQVFGVAESGEVDTVYEAEGYAVIDGGKLFVTEKTTELVDYAPMTTEAEFQIEILDGVVQKTPC